MTYVVNGEEFSTKKDATAALFEAAERGEAATLTKVEPEAESSDEANAEQPHAGIVGSPAEGPGFGPVA